MKSELTVASIAKMIDHSLLHPTMTDKKLKSGCLLAKDLKLASVCIKPYAVSMAKSLLDGSGVKTGTVVGFPHGGGSTAIKVNETVEACTDGAEEIDMVINIGKLLGKDFDYVKEEIAAINQSAIGGGAILKVIFENDFLDDESIVTLCKICGEIGVAFIKTSTGYGFVKGPDGFYSYNGATERQLRIMKKHCLQGMEIKAAGGVRTLKDLLFVRSLGVTRIGATASLEIIETARKIVESGETISVL